MSESAYMRNVHPHGGQPGGVRHAFVNDLCARPADTLAEQVGGRGESVEFDLSGMKTTSVVPQNKDMVL